MEPTYHITFPGLGEWATFDINPVAFSIGSFEIRWYGILIAAGALLAMLYAFKNCKRFGINPDKLIDAVIVGFITGIIGARLYYVIFYDFSYYMSHPLSILNLKEGGLAIYGGIIGALLGGLPVIKHHKQNVLAVLDLVVIGFLIGQGIGRWGNFVNQEAYGVATDLPWRMVSEGTGGIGVHPCFLYESLWCLLGVLVLHLVCKKRQYDGQIFLLYLVWYGAERFVVEGLRTDSLYILNLRVSQLLALITALVGIFCLILFRNRRSLWVERQKEAKIACASASGSVPLAVDDLENSQKNSDSSEDSSSSHISDD